MFNHLKKQNWSVLNQIDTCGSGLSRLSFNPNINLWPHFNCVQSRFCEISSVFMSFLLRFVHQTEASPSEELLQNLSSSRSFWHTLDPVSAVTAEALIQISVDPHLFSQKYYNRSEAETALNVLLTCANKKILLENFICPTFQSWNGWWWNDL